MTQERLILGIDPGTNILGYGIIKVTNKNRVELVISGVLDMQKLSDPYIKLQKIFRRITDIIDTYHPDELAIESQFFGKNVQSMLKLGRAQGVAIAAALERDMPITEYAPRKIKQSITGTGTASKEQIAILLSKFMKFKTAPQTYDETDAIAIAYCHYLQAGNIVGEKSYKSWGEFVKKNPAKIKK